MKHDVKNKAKNDQIIKNFWPKIGIFTSASPLPYFFQSRMQRTREIFLENEMIVEFGSLIDEHIGSYTSGNVMDRVNEFNSLLENCKFLMSSIGGFNTSSILDGVNYQLIRKKQTKILGMSDTTALLLAVYKETGIPTYYGQSFLKSYNECDFVQKYSLTALKNLFIANKFPQEIKKPDYYTDQCPDWKKENRAVVLKNNEWIWLNRRKISGRLLGGNLNTMVSLIGTKYMPEFRTGDILFIEDSEKTIAECERNFVALKNSGILDKISAVIIGKPEKINYLDANITYEQLFFNFLNRKIPVLMNFDCGHTIPTTILKIGGTILLDGYEEKVILLD